MYVAKWDIKSLSIKVYRRNYLEVNVSLMYFELKKKSPKQNRDLQLSEFYIILTSSVTETSHIWSKWLKFLLWNCNWIKQLVLSELENHYWNDINKSYATHVIYQCIYNHCIIPSFMFIVQRALYKMFSYYICLPACLFNTNFFMTEIFLKKKI